MISISNIYKSFNRKAVLKGVSLALEEGEIVGLVGPSGSGKSVLLKIIGGVIPPDFGEVKRTDVKQEDENFKVGFLFQEGALFDSLTVLENVAFPLHAEAKRCWENTQKEELSRDSIYTRALEILDEVGLSAAINKMPGQLSGGMRRRVGIARALVSNPDLVLLDDPTCGLDPVAASLIIRLIKTLHSRYNPTVVLVSHDIRRLLPNVSRVVGLFEGNIVCDAKPSELMDSAPAEVISFLATRYDFTEQPRG